MNAATTLDEVIAQQPTRWGAYTMAAARAMPADDVEGLSRERCVDFLDATDAVLAPIVRRFASFLQAAER